MSGLDRKILVAMSGGVDSSVAAALMQAQGYTVSGATLKLFSNEEIGLNEREQACCSLADTDDARRVAYRLGITHYVFNFSRRFRAEVMDRFIAGYAGGRTPNPCIDCNKYIKFAALLERALTLGYDGIATGHYAVNQFDQGSGRWLLKKPLDSSKDQTYVLYGMTQRQLANTLFPLGGLTKSEVRSIAGGLGLGNADKPDSQDICFVPDGDYAAFIARDTGRQPIGGDFIDTEQRVLGRHRGLPYYTVGQRKGLGSGFGQRLYVLRLNRETNTVTLGPEKKLYAKSLVAEEVNLIAVDRLTAPLQVQVKIRYSQTEEPATIHPLDQGEVLVEFARPQRAVAPGQAAVFYDGEIVLGGGTIKA